MKFSEFPKMEKPDRRPEFLDAVKAAGQLMIDQAEDIVPQDIWAVCDIDIRVKIDVFCGAPLPTLEVQTHRFPQIFRPEPSAKEGEE